MLFKSIYNNAVVIDIRTIRFRRIVTGTLDWSGYVRSSFVQNLSVSRSYLDRVLFLKNKTRQIQASKSYVRLESNKKKKSYPFRLTD